MCNRKLQAWLGSLILVAASCGGGSGGSPSAPPPPPPGGGGGVVEVSVRDNRFDPQQLRIQPGQTVRWVLRGNLTNHTATANNGAFDSGFRFTSQGAAFEHTFTAADDDKTFEYACISHQVCCQMQGSVLVGDGAPAPGPGY